MLTYLKSRGTQPSKVGKLVREYGFGNYWGIETRVMLDDGTVATLVAGKKYTTDRHLIWYRVKVDGTQYPSTIMTLDTAPEWAKEELLELGDSVSGKWYWNWGNEADYRYPDMMDITPEWANGYRMEVLYDGSNLDGEVRFYNEEGELVIIASNWGYMGQELYDHITQHLAIELEWAGFNWE
jgi:hypothetical protein